MEVHAEDARLGGEGQSPENLVHENNGHSPYLDPIGMNKQCVSSSCTTMCDSGDENQNPNPHGGQLDCGMLQQNYPMNYGYHPQYDNFDLATFINNSFNKKDGGVISGVKFQPSDNRWIARWTTADGKRACKSFSVNIYGFEQARALAIEARQKGVSLSGRSFCNRERQHAMRSGVGIIGIRFDKTQARWVSSYYEGGKRKFRYFTVKDYGYEQAKQHAILWKTCNDERLIRNRVQHNEVMDFKMTEGPMEQVMPPHQWNAQPFQQPYVGYYQQPQLDYCNQQNECVVQYDQPQMQQSLIHYKPSAISGQQSVETRSPSLSTSASVSGYVDPNEQMCYNYQSDLPYQYNHPQYAYDQQQQMQYMGEEMDQYPLEHEHEEDTCSVSGVTFDRKNRRWGARWTTPDGRRAGRYFPVRQYGFSEAKRLAVICRLQAIEENRVVDIMPPLDLNMQQSCGEPVNDSY
ncbi:transcription factor with AP2 domain-containing protein [Babesia ovata]|uniref:Transcription factor with AP2 domain-containing protein n=1 Tax=Babesia ovata TaxID=189622 RepID=A0A2H6KHG9_9APIC|nr:transcription factor with AP2 domain-containing protein [Babesia ovata]GBE62421.1 transcription factor with AP2 domain-containing protein [Babesia ovata]